MGMNISRGNMYQFVTHTWNAIKGKCPHDCTYCYMKSWGSLRDVRIDKHEFKTDLGNGNFIFVGSSCDVFANGIPQEWIDATLDHCRKFDNRYLFQSKNPGRMAGQMGGLDAVYCTTIETNRWYPEIMRNSPRPGIRAGAMSMLSGRRRFVTIDPIMDFDLGVLVSLIRLCEPEQVNIGADSKGHNLPEPMFDKVLELIDAVSEFSTVSKKRNLKRLQGANT